MFDDFDHDQRMRSLTPVGDRPPLPSFPTIIDRIWRNSRNGWNTLNASNVLGNSTVFLAQPPSGINDGDGYRRLQSPCSPRSVSSAFAPASRVDIGINKTQPSHVYQNGYPGVHRHNGPPITPHAAPAPYRHNGPPTLVRLPFRSTHTETETETYGPPRRAPPPPAGSQVKAEPKQGARRLWPVYPHARA